MVRNIEIYDGKYIDIDFDKVKKYICNIFLTTLLCLLFILPNKIGDDYMSSIMYLREISLIVVSYTAMLVLIVVKVLDKDIKIDVFDILLIIYATFIALSCLFSEYKFNVLTGFSGRGEGALELLAYIFCFYITKETFKYNDKVFKLLTYLLIFASAVGLMQALNKTGYEFKIYKVYDEWKYMAASNFDNPNMFSSLLSLFLPMYIILYTSKGNNKILPVLIFIFSALVATKTLGGYITFALYFLGIFVYFLIASKDKLKIIKLYTVMLALFILVFLVMNTINNNVYIKEIFGLNDEVNIENDKVSEFAHGRGAIWKLSFDMIKNNMLFGVGPDSMGCELLTNYRHLYEKGFAVDKAHSEYLHIAVTTGVPSLIIYGVFIATILIKLLLEFIKKNREKATNNNKVLFVVAVSVSIISYLFQAVANISTICVAPFFWCMLGIGANICKKETQNS